MTIIEELKLMNYTKIDYLKEVKKDYTRNKIIKEILKDETCFFKMNKEDAYMILQDIGVSINNLEEIYSKLISTDEFYRLVKENKIEEDDNEIKIKYKKYNTNIF